MLTVRRMCRPARMAHRPSGDRSKHAMGTPVSYVMFCCEVGRYAAAAGELVKPMPPPPSSCPGDSAVGLPSSLRMILPWLLMYIVYRLALLQLEGRSLVALLHRWPHSDGDPPCGRGKAIDRQYLGPARRAVSCSVWCVVFGLLRG